MAAPEVTASLLARKETLRRVAVVLVIAVTVLFSGVMLWMVFQILDFTEEGSRPAREVLRIQRSNEQRLIQIEENVQEILRRQTPAPAPAATP